MKYKTILMLAKYLEFKKYCGKDLNRNVELMRGIYE